MRSAVVLNTFIFGLASAVPVELSERTASHAAHWNLNIQVGSVEFLHPDVPHKTLGVAAKCYIGAMLNCLISMLNDRTRKIHIISGLTELIETAQNFSYRT